MPGSCSDHGRNRPSIVIRVFTCFLNCRVRGAALCEPPCADFVAGAALCEPPCADFVAGTALCEPPCADFVAGAALCEPPRADFVAGTALCEPPCADVVASTALCESPRFSEPRRGKLRGTTGTTVATRSRVMVGSCSDHGRNRPSIVIRVFTCFLKCRVRGRHSTL